VKATEWQPLDCELRSEARGYQKADYPTPRAASVLLKFTP